MSNNIRKDSYIKASTDFGPVYGRVTKVAGNSLFVTTDAGQSARVARSESVKITAAEFKASAGKTAGTFDKADAGVTVDRPEPKAAAVTRPTAPVALLAAPAPKTERPGGVRRPGEKGTGKKATAVALYAELTVDGNAPTRKDFLAAMAKAGLSDKGASTYFYNIRKAVAGKAGFESWRPAA